MTASLTFPSKLFIGNTTEFRFFFLLVQWRGMPCCSIIPCGMSINFYELAHMQFFRYQIIVFFSLIPKHLEIDKIMKTILMHCQQFKTFELDRNSRQKHNTVGTVGAGTLMDLFRLYTASSCRSPGKTKFLFSLKQACLIMQTHNRRDGYLSSLHI